VSGCGQSQRGQTGRSRKIVVPEAINYLCSPGLTVFSRILQARGHRGRITVMARGDNGRHPRRGGVASCWAC